MLNQQSLATGEESAPGPLDLSERIASLNINETTYLATDYLNHFGEVIMLLDLVPDMPAVLEEIRDWQPKTYQQHFHDSGFAQSDVYVLAYENAPREFREPFDATIALLQDRISKGLVQVGQIIGQDDKARLADTVAEIAMELQTLNSQAGAIVNGDHQANKQDAIDALFDD